MTEPSQVWHPSCRAWSGEHECVPESAARRRRLWILLAPLAAAVAGAAWLGLSARPAQDPFLAMQPTFAAGAPEGGSTTLERHGDVCAVVQTWREAPTPEGVQAAAQHYPPAGEVFQSTDCRFVMLVVRVEVDGLVAEEALVGPRCSPDSPCQGKERLVP